MRPPGQPPHYDDVRRPIALGSFGINIGSDLEIIVLTKRVKFSSIPFFSKIRLFHGAGFVCTGVDNVVLKTRRLILESAGHNVATVMDETALLAAYKEHSFDVAVIGQAVSPNMKPPVLLVFPD